jgi:hypothetical protein
MAASVGDGLSHEKRTGLDFVEDAFMVKRLRRAETEGGVISSLGEGLVLGRVETGRATKLKPKASKRLVSAHVGLGWFFMCLLQVRQRGGALESFETVAGIQTGAVRRREQSR